MPVTLSACPTHADRTAPTPENLTYSLTLPSTLTSPAMARAATRTMLAAHGLRDILDAALLAIAELAGLPIHRLARDLRIAALSRGRAASDHVRQPPVPRERAGRRGLRGPTPGGAASAGPRHPYLWG